MSCPSPCPLCHEMGTRLCAIVNPAGSLVLADGRYRQWDAWVSEGWRCSACQQLTHTGRHHTLALAYEERRQGFLDPAGLYAQYSMICIDQYEVAEEVAFARRVDEEIAWSIAWKRWGRPSVRSELRPRRCCRFSATTSMGPPGRTWWINWRKRCEVPHDRAGMAGNQRSEGDGGGRSG